MASAGISPPLGFSSSPQRSNKSRPSALVSSENSAPARSRLESPPGHSTDLSNGLQTEEEAAGPGQKGRNSRKLRSASRSARQSNSISYSRSGSPLGGTPTRIEGHSLSHRPSQGTMSSVSHSPVPNPTLLTPSLSSIQSLPSRHLVTIIPPPYLPHDPPHPRTSPFCTGYGPPQNFSRGVLVPLYPTLAGQIGAIAREYGLPSTGGVILYLVETTSDLIDNGLNQAFVGGPRIGDDAWSLLWARLFEAEAEERERQRLQYEEDESYEMTDREENSYHSSNFGRPPPVPPIPANHRYRRANASVEEEQVVTPQSISDTSMSAEMSVEDESHDYADAPQPKRPQSRTGKRVLHSRVYSDAHSANRPLSASTTRTRHSYYYSTRPTTSHSMHSAARSPLAASHGYGASVIVGKLEFDIDRRRGGSRWFDAWMEGAQVGPQGNTSLGQVSGVSSPLSQQPSQASYASASSRLYQAETSRISQHSNSSDNSFSPHQSAIFSSATNDARQSAGPTLYSSVSSQGLTGSLPRKLNLVGTHESLANTDEDEFTVHPRQATEPRQETASVDSEPIVEDVSESKLNAEVDQIESIKIADAPETYEPLQDSDSDYEEKQEPAFEAQAETTRPLADPLADTFGTDESHWQHTLDSAPDITTGLGIVGASEEEADLPAQNDVQEVKDLLDEKTRNSQPSLLSSPIHLSEETTADGGEEGSESVEATIIGNSARDSELSDYDRPSAFGKPALSAPQEAAPTPTIPNQQRPSADYPPISIQSVLSTTVTQQTEPDRRSHQSSHSQQSSVDMTDDLDQLERALADLSPRSAKTQKSRLAFPPARTMNASASLATVVSASPTPAPPIIEVPPARTVSRSELATARSDTETTSQSNRPPSPAYMRPQRSTSATASPALPTQEVDMDDSSEMTPRMPPMQSSPVAVQEAPQSSASDGQQEQMAKIGPVNAFSAPRSAPLPSPGDSPFSGQSLRLKKSWTKDKNLPKSKPMLQSQTFDRNDQPASPTFLQKFGWKRKASEPSSLPASPAISGDESVGIPQRSLSFDASAQSTRREMPPIANVQNPKQPSELSVANQPDITLSRMSTGGNEILHEGSGQTVGESEVSPTPLSPNRRHGFTGQPIRTYNLAGIASDEPVIDSDEEVASPTAAEKIGQLLTSP